MTHRMRPLWVEGRTVHQVGLPYHWGYNGLAKGDVANDLLVISEEPNVRIMETKALVCDIEPGRRARGPEALEQLERTSGATGMSATIDAFLTDSTLCIGCKACEVACKEWNGLPTTDSTGRATPMTTPARSATRRGGT